MMSMRDLGKSSLTVQRSMRDGEMAGKMDHVTSVTANQSEWWMYIYTGAIINNLCKQIMCISVHANQT